MCQIPSSVKIDVESRKTAHKTDGQKIHQQKKTNRRRFLILESYKKREPFGNIIKRKKKHWKNLYLVPHPSNQ